MAEKNSLLSPRFFINPVYWFTWLGIGFLYLTSLLPYSKMLALGKGIGWLSYVLMPQRRRITRTNIRLAFPELDKQATRELVKRSFYSASMGIFESALAWWGKDERIKPMLHVEGMENLQAAMTLGKGVMLLGGHYTTVEMSGRLLSYHAQIYFTYKRALNPLFEAVMTRVRRTRQKGMIRSNDMRSTLKLLKQNEIIWYAPDQDFGIEPSVFAPFMGVQTATLTMTARLAMRSGSPMVPFHSQRLPDNQGYVIRFAPMLKNYPTGNDVQDATAINAAIEKFVRLAPEQYLWGHRRFKTRPRGEPLVYKPRRGKFLHRYTYTHALLCIPIILYTAWIAIRNRQLGYFSQRCGLSLPSQADIIIHAASIGEVKALVPLLDLILETRPELNVLLSVNTPSGRRTAEMMFNEKVHVRYMPIDWHWLVYLYLGRINPKCILIMETEIWPNFYEYCFYKGIPHIIVNARLSERTTRVPVFVRHWLGQAIRESTAILARSKEDADRFLSLSAREQNVQVLGNLKYAATPPEQMNSIEVGRPYVLLASSRDGEEKLIVPTWLSVKDSSQYNENPILVIAPRHIQRLNSILADLKSITPNIAIRSHGDNITSTTDVYIADTFGELTSLMYAAELVIMGGSFVPFGGQNIIEAAHARKAVVFGPYMDNFKLEAQQFLAADAAIQVNDQAGLKDVLHALLNDPIRLQQLGNNGAKLIAQHRHVAQTYLQELQKHCECLQPAT